MSPDLLAILLLMQPRIPSAFFAERMHSWLMFNLASTTIPSPFLSTCFSAGQLPEHTGAWGFLSQVQEMALPFVKLHEVCISPFLQPVEVPLDSSTCIWCTSHSSQFCNISKFCLYTTPLMKMLKGTEPNTDTGVQHQLLHSNQNSYINHEVQDPTTQQDFHPPPCLLPK